MNWKLKAAVLRVLSVLPLGGVMLYQLQRFVTREMPRKPAVVEELLAASRSILQLYEQSTGIDIAKEPCVLNFLEIGAGRDLAVALSLRMLGVSTVTCLDVQRLARINLIQHTANQLALLLGTPVPKFSCWQDVERYGIRYAAPADIENLSQDRGSYDCFYSTDVLEHIPPADLSRIVRYSLAMLKPTGLCIHLIDYSDHYARSDASLSRFNFLRFNPRGWARYNPSLHYVNRLRHSQYVTLFRQAGYRLTVAEPIPSPPETELLGELAQEFSCFAVDDLFMLRATIVGHPDTSAGLRL